MADRNIVAYKGNKPQIGHNVFIADGARVIGNVSISRQASIWFNAVIRGDVNAIRIGENTNIQDNCVFHVTGESPCVIGDNVTVGHGAIIHGCRIEKNCLIGMGAIILNHAEIGENCIVGAGALIAEKKKIPPRSLVVGSPGRVVRAVSEEEVAALADSAVYYHQLAEDYMNKE